MLVYIHAYVCKDNKELYTLQQSVYSDIFQVTMNREISSKVLRLAAPQAKMLWLFRHKNWVFM